MHAIRRLNVIILPLNTVKAETQVLYWQKINVTSN